MGRRAVNPTRHRKRPLPHTRTAGFTLLELMIVVAVVGILVSIAYPSYRQHIVKTRRTDAEADLMGLANAMERHFTESGTYLGAGTTSGNTGAPTVYSDQSPSDGGTAYYNLTIQSATQTSYALRATPTGDQAGDGYLELSSTGARGWDSNDDGDTADAGENTW